MLVQRQWKHDHSDLHTDTFLEIWDGGSRRYERWPDGTECCWEVVLRDYQNDSIHSELLLELPSWNTPADIMWYEKVPVHSLENGFQIPGWSVTQTISQANTPQTHRPIHVRQPENVKHNKKPHKSSGPRHKSEAKQRQS